METIMDEDTVNLGFGAISIVYSNDGTAPTVDIGDLSPMFAYGILHAALETVDMLTSHCNVSSNGRELLTVQDYFDDPEIEDE